MCDVLRLIYVIFLKRQHKLYMIFCVSNFFKWANLRLSVNAQKPSVSASGELRPPYSLTRGSAPGPRPRPLIVGASVASHLLRGSNSLTPALRAR